MLKLRVCLCFFGFLIYSKGKPLKTDVNLIFKNVECFEIVTDESASFVTILPQVVSFCENLLNNVNESSVTFMCQDLIKWKLCDLLHLGLDENFGDLAESEMEKYNAEINAGNATRLCQALSFLNISDCQHVCIGEGQNLCSYYGGMVIDLQRAFNGTMEDDKQVGYKLLDKFKHTIKRLMPFPPLGTFQTNPEVEKCLDNNTIDIDDVCRLLAHISVLSMQVHAIEISHTKYLLNTGRKEVDCKLLMDKKEVCKAACVKTEASSTQRGICRMIAFGVEQLYDADSQKKVQSTIPEETKTYKKETEETKTDTKETEETKTDKKETEETKTDKKETEETKTDKKETEVTKTDKKETEETKTDKKETDNITIQAPTTGTTASTTNSTSTKGPAAEASIANKTTASLPEVLANQTNSTPVLLPEDKNPKITAAPKPNIAPSTAKPTAEKMIDPPTTPAETLTTTSIPGSEESEKETDGPQENEANKAKVETNNATDHCTGGGGKSSAGRRPSTKKYKKLKTEDVMPNLEHSASSKTYVF